MGRVNGLWQAFGLVFVMALALEAFALLTPMFTQWVVDEALVWADRGLLNVLVLASFLLMVTQTAVSQARGWTVMYLSTHLNLQWVGNVFSHLLRLPVAWFEKRHLGDIISRFGSVDAIQRTLTTTFIGAMLDGLMAIATFVMMIAYSRTFIGGGRDFRHVVRTIARRLVRAALINWLRFRFTLVFYINVLSLPENISR